MRLIDGDELIKKFNEKADVAKCLIDERTADRFATFCMLADAVEEMPTVDAMPVIYCKDCKYADTERRNATEKRYYNSILFCRNSNLCNDEPLAMWPDDFCSYGVTKEDADEES